MRQPKPGCAWSRQNASVCAQVHGFLRLAGKSHFPCLCQSVPLHVRQSLEFVCVFVCSPRRRCRSPQRDYPLTVGSSSFPSLPQQGEGERHPFRSLASVENLCVASNASRRFGFIQTRPRLSRFKISEAGKAEVVDCIAPPSLRNLPLHRPLAPRRTLTTDLRSHPYSQRSTRA